MILGLDVSTKCTGWAVYDDGKLIDFGAIKTPTTTKSTLYTKMTKVIDSLFEIRDKHQITHVYIEEILNKFAAGKSTAKTIVSLARFNGIVSFKVWEIFGIEPQYVAAVSARKVSGIKVHRGEDAKEVVLQRIINMEQTFTVEYTKFGNIAEHCYDIADAIVIARAGYGQEVALN